MFIKLSTKHKLALLILACLVVLVSGFLYKKKNLSLQQSKIVKSTRIPIPTGSGQVVNPQT